MLLIELATVFAVLKKEHWVNNIGEHKSKVLITSVKILFLFMIFYILLFNKVFFQTTNVRFFIYFLPLQMKNLY